MFLVYYFIYLVYYFLTTLFLVVIRCLNLVIMIENSWSGTAIMFAPN